MCHSTPQHLCFPPVGGQTMRADGEVVPHPQTSGHSCHAILTVSLGRLSALRQQSVISSIRPILIILCDPPRATHLSHRLWRFAVQDEVFALRWEKSFLPGWGALVCILITVLTIQGIPKAAAAFLS
jgi:hypothetical protein